MTWRGVFDGRAWLMAPRALNALLPMGTLVLETQLGVSSAAPVTLIDHVRRDGWDRALSLTLGPGGRVTLTDRQGPSHVRAHLDAPLTEDDLCLRIYYGWNAPARRGALAIELPDTGRWLRVPVHAPHPLPEDDLAMLAQSVGPRVLDGGTGFLAWSDAVEPVGPMPGLGEGTPIETASGPKQVQSLVPGDLVRTAADGFLPVRHVLTREVPAAARLAPVLLAAPALGLAADVLVAPGHRMRIEGADAEYLFNEDAVLVEARHLVPIAAVPLGHRRATQRYHQVVLDRHACVSIAGAWGESQFLGNPGAQLAQRIGTVLAPLSPRDLPRHDTLATPLLRSYEAAVLVAAIGA